MKITKMTCNGMINPLGFAMENARLSWMMEAEGSNHLQTAFEVEVHWENGSYASGKIESSQSVEWALPVALDAMTRYFWRVRVWDENDQPSEWSEESWFETARGDAPWDAEWIGWQKDLPEMRKVFTLSKPVRRARAYACGVGLYALFLNGSRMGDEHLNPNFNAYDQWLQYQTFEITDQLHEGENTLGAWLGMGYYAGRVGWPGIEKRKNIYGKELALIAQIEIDGDTLTFTDVMGEVTTVEGKLLSADLTAGVVIFSAS